ncbi:hypothetical protein WEI85_19925 [Actinomycetes bacterium KLBMP 9797]
MGNDAARVRWFALDGPDTLDNGLAVWHCTTKLFDRGVLGIGLDMRVCVSAT